MARRPMWISTISIAFSPAHRHLLALLSGTLLLTACTAKPLRITDDIGMVTVSSGFPSVMRHNQTYMLANESTIYPDDILDTDEDSKIQIRLVDGTLVSLGSNSHIVFHSFEYDQYKIWANIDVTFTGGAIRVTRPGYDGSGQILIATPLAAIASNSDDFWAGFVFAGRTLGITMFSGGPIAVSNRDGSTELTRPGNGVKVAAGAAPQAPQAWESGMIETATKSTTF